jgi:hypothetical protein
MKYAVSVCECGYRLLNIVERGNANQKDLRAFRRFAKENKCHFGIGLKTCPRCKVAIEEGESSIRVNGPDDIEAIDRSAKAIRELLNFPHHQG